MPLGDLWNCLVLEALWCWSPEFTEQTPADWWLKPSTSVNGLFFLPGGEKPQGPVERMAKQLISL